MKGTAERAPEGKVLAQYMASHGVIVLFRDGAGATHRCVASFAGNDPAGRWVREQGACHDCPEEECDGTRAAVAALALHPRVTGVPATTTIQDLRAALGSAPAPRETPPPSPEPEEPTEPARTRRSGLTRPTRRR